MAPSVMFALTDEKNNAVFEFLSDGTILINGVPSGGSGGILLAKVTLSAADLSTLQSANSGKGAILIPAPGVKKSIVVFGATGIFIPGVVWASGATTAGICYGVLSNPIISSFGPDLTFGGSSLISLQTGMGSNSFNNAGLSNVENQPVTLTDTANATGSGTGTMQVWIWYSIITRN